MSLQDWTRSDIESAVRQILQATYQDCAPAECQKWATRFIQHELPSWVPGTKLEPEQAQRVGRAFASEYLRVCRRVLHSVFPRRQKRP